MRTFWLRPPGKLFFVLALLLQSLFGIAQQPTFPVNGVADPRARTYAFTHATIVKDGQTTLANATLVISEGRIVAAGTTAEVPKDAVVIDCSGKYIYPSFIDIYSDYGIPAPERKKGGFNFRGPSQLESETKGAFGWNQAIKPEVDGSKLFV
ncbi:MAG: amidohydrolase, partial [Bacteroidetes bacterium]|nr:amidohydrolase [Bacteroidota bacterium]